MILEWKAGDKFYTESQCGRYTVSAGFHGDKWIYSAWRIARPMWKELDPRGFATSGMAKRACQEFEDASAVAK